MSSDDNIINFKLEESDFIQLCDLLKRVGLCENGGHAKAEISEGNVLVNEKIEMRKRCKIKSNDIVRFAEAKILVD